MKRFITIVTALILVLTVFGGCSSSTGTGTYENSKETTAAENSENVSAESVTSEEMTEATTAEAVVDNRKNTEDFSDEDFEVVAYSYTTSFGDTMLFLSIKNNSSAAVSISGEGTLKDAEGNVIAVDDASVDVLGPGEETITYFYFDSVESFDSADYQLKYKRENYYQPVIGNLDVQQNLNDQNVTLVVTNEGDINAQFVEAYALFFNSEDKVIGYSSEYITDHDSEIKVGATLSAQLDMYSSEGYDHVNVFLTGRSDGSSTTASDALVTTDDLEIKDYMYENSIGDSLYFLVIKNNGEVDTGIAGNATAYDVEGNVLGADDTEIDVIGPGQESITYFYFDGASGIDHVEYQLQCVTDLYYKDGLSLLSYEKSENAENVIVTLTNNGDEAVSFAEGYALFFDAEGNMVGFSSNYFTDDDSEIKPGESITKEMDFYGQSYDHTEVYFTGRIYTR